MTVGALILDVLLVLGIMLTGIALFVLCLLVPDWWRDRQRRGDEVTYKPAVASGTLLCDFVDHDQLRSIAEQNGVRLPANQIVTEDEKSSSQTWSWRKLWRGQWGKRTNTATTTKPLDDSNEIVKRVLQKLLEDQKLDYEVAMTHVIETSTGADSEENARRDVAVLDGLKRVLTFNDVEVGRRAATAAREALDRHSQGDPATQHLPVFEQAVQRSAWVLVDVSWEVAKNNGDICLKAQHLNKRSYPPVEPLEAAPMPDGLGIAVKVPTNDLEQYGHRHLASAENEIRVKVFGMASRCAGGTLEVVPVAVFSQIG